MIHLLVESTSAEDELTAVDSNAATANNHFDGQPETTHHLKPESNAILEVQTTYPSNALLPSTASTACQDPDQHQSTSIHTTRFAPVSPPFPTVPSNPSSSHSHPLHHQVVHEASGWVNEADQHHRDRLPRPPTSTATPITLPPLSSGSLSGSFPSSSQVVSPLPSLHQMHQTRNGWEGSSNCQGQPVLPSQRHEQHCSDTCCLRQSSVRRQGPLLQPHGTSNYPASQPHQYEARNGYGSYLSHSLHGVHGQYPDRNQYSSHTSTHQPSTPLVQHSVHSPSFYNQRQMNGQATVNHHSHQHYHHGEQHHHQPHSHQAVTQPHHYSSHHNPHHNLPFQQQQQQQQHQLVQNERPPYLYSPSHPQVSAVNTPLHHHHSTPPQHPVEHLGPPHYHATSAHQPQESQSMRQTVMYHQANSHDHHHQHESQAVPPTHTLDHANYLHSSQEQNRSQQHQQPYFDSNDQQQQFQHPRNQHHQSSSASSSSSTPPEGGATMHNFPAFQKPPRQIPHPGRSFTCAVEHCGKVFYRKHHLVSHMVSHTEGKPFTCPRDGCDATFRRNQDLRRHLRNVKHVE